ncbi:phage protein [Fructobacillus pseudoficulneus]|uniref:Phage protein n=1 Tax=Fructobacillus pseudoficulneus TaxID=220714 RepID=A0A3F3GZN8_9LACO|nr:helix-turn-helix domain-containing protein [Fructobacillus pseudoficulneus]GAP03372.1 phage protein [Fructobacillus pseudoficulneus]SEH43690.1 Sugar-specific transcriptional regulator TrmB [Fructobacillus pseudoficulneus]
MIDVRHQDQLTRDEKKVYMALPFGKEKAIKVRNLSKVVGIPERRVYDILNHLSSHSYLVGSFRNQRGGVYRITNKDEYFYTLNMLRNNAKSYERRVRGLEQHRERFE